MKLTGGKAEAFLRNPGAGVIAVLIHGPDAGLIRERAEGLAHVIAGNPLDPFRTAEISGSTLRKDRAFLMDEACAVAFTGGRRVIRVRDATDALFGIFEDFFASFNGESLVVAEAGELGSRSSLRKIFEKNSKGAAIGCYADNQRSLESVIRNTLSKAEVSVDRNAMAYLLENLGSDRGVSRRELEKLALYTGQGKTASLEDAMACVGDNAASSLDSIVYAVAGGRLGDLDRALRRAFLEGAQPVQVIRAVARHLLKLHWVVGRVAKGASPEVAIKDLRPLIIFKFVDAFRAQVRIWQGSLLPKALSLAMEAELDCKTTGFPAEAICSRTLMRIAQMANAGRVR